ncbi:hypothetical protein [Actinoplanes sp. ATCC 53533]|uniref:hypothetical protein n=1 Tax=Actinoplanes sp. ATCC 53533 TaxID=1288362 RepID=UPI000F78816E|nr:hypothetical protein [Actinoplanes sp. ATCC 53533]
MNVIAKSATRVVADAAATVVQTTVTAALAADFGPLALPAGATAGAAVKEIPILAQMFADRRRSATDMMEHAVAYAGVNPERFMDALAADPKHRHLLRRAIHAAGDSVSGEKIRTLAAALAAGAIATDDAVVDESMLVIDAVAQLEAVHLRVLALLATEPDDPAVDHYQNIRPWPWTPQQIHNGVPQLSAVLPAILAKLQALGITKDFPNGLIDYEEGRRQLTGFGELCLVYLQTLAGEQHDPDEGSGIRRGAAVMTA